MNIKKLPRDPVRPEKEPNAEVEIWQPNWKCFCCHDTGIINPKLVTEAIEGYDYNRDKLPRCGNPGCKAGSHWDNEALTGCIDYRINAATCQKLDAMERENWRKTVQKMQININALAQKMSLRKRDAGGGTLCDHAALSVNDHRTPEEVSNTDLDLMQAMAQEYLGSDYMKNGSE